MKNERASLQAKEADAANTLNGNVRNQNEKENKEIRK